MHYETIVSQVSYEDKTVQTYGIKATDTSGTVRTVEDISTNKSAVEALVTLCNREGLALCHLDDVIEDFLS